MTTIHQRINRPRLLLVSLRAPVLSHGSRAGSGKALVTTMWPILLPVILRLWKLPSTHWMDTISTWGNLKFSLRNSPISAETCQNQHVATDDDQIQSLK